MAKAAAIKEDRGDRDAILGSIQSGFSWRAPGFGVSAALGLAGALLIFGLSDQGAATVAASGLLLVFALALGVWLSGWQSRQLTTCVAASQKELAEAQARVSELLAAVGPVWARQIDTCRASADEAVADLTRNFSQMVDRLEATLSASKGVSSAMGSADKGIVAAIRRSEADLANVVNTLNDLQHSRAVILGKVGEYAKDLREMATEVQQIALQLRLLSLNGTIEAARAGQAGKSFAIVAGEMRGLSGKSAELGSKISKQVGFVNNMLADMFLDNDISKGQDTELIDGAERDIEAVLARFGDLSTGLLRSVEVLGRESEAVKERISEALVALQFQDRVSQILTHVSDGVAQLGISVAQHEERPVGVDTWLTEIAQAYSTDEEFDNLAGRSRARGVEHGIQFF